MKQAKYPVLRSLKGKIREEGSSYRDLAEKLGVSPSTVSQKLNGWSLFDVEEMTIICNELNIGIDEIPRYFLP